MAYATYPFIHHVIHRVVWRLFLTCIALQIVPLCSGSARCAGSSGCPRASIETACPLDSPAVGVSAEIQRPVWLEQGALGSSSFLLPSRIQHSIPRTLHSRSFPLQTQMASIHGTPGLAVLWLLLWCCVVAQSEGATGAPAPTAPAVFRRRPFGTQSWGWCYTSPSGSRLCYGSTGPAPPTGVPSPGVSGTPVTGAGRGGVARTVRPPCKGSMCMFSWALFPPRFQVSAKTHLHVPKIPLQGRKHHQVSSEGPW